MFLPGETNETDDSSGDESPSACSQKIWLYGPWMRYWGAFTTLYWALMAVVSLLRFPISLSFAGDLSWGSISICMALWMYSLELSYWNSVTIETDGQLIVRWRTILSSHQCRICDFRLARSDLISKNVGLPDHQLALALEITSDEDALEPSPPSKRFYLYHFSKSEFPIRTWRRQLRAQTCALEQIWQSVPANRRLEREAKPGVPPLRFFHRYGRSGRIHSQQDLRAFADVVGGFLFVNWLIAMVTSLCS